MNQIERCAFSDQPSAISYQLSAISYPPSAIRLKLKLNFPGRATCPGFVATEQDKYSIDV